MLMAWQIHMLFEKRCSKIMAKKVRKQNVNVLNSVNLKIKEALRIGATVLDLSDSNIKSLPESIGQLTGLQFLSLDNNQLTSLPESIVHLSRLQK